MNSHYLFLTIHGHGVDVKTIEKELQEKHPEWDITVSEKEFEQVR